MIITHSTMHAVVYFKLHYPQAMNIGYVSLLCVVYQLKLNHTQLLCMVNLQGLEHQPNSMPAAVYS